MTDHMPMPKVSRLEVVSTGARRRWTLEEKQRIVTESYGGPRLVSVTARRNGLSTSQLFTWRRLTRGGKLSGDGAPVLVPVEITAVAAPVSISAPQPTSSAPAQRPRVGIIEIELGGGCRVRVDRDVDGEALQRVLELLRRR
ncbi:IS66-like element accessory protein TnpA [Bradyrhizobium yuanmingense]|uniref:IS66-like element accessory protein TnpA n=1 Tax=Bradyrhizobium yuanmingense TaxID=108015 RepID=UPI0023BA1968|nr:transposase [Bradyrhizobium yuanmingense]MDF0581978.1 transposase [Bradyrhizobium yuanmingense]